MLDEALSEHRNNIVALGVGIVEAFSPADQFAMVNLELPKNNG